MNMTCHRVSHQRDVLKRPSLALISGGGGQRRRVDTRCQPLFPPFPDKCTFKRLRLDCFLSLPWRSEMEGWWKVGCQGPAGDSSWVVLQTLARPAGLSLAPRHTTTVITFEEKKKPPLSAPVTDTHTLINRQSVFFFYSFRSLPRLCCLACLLSLFRRCKPSRLTLIAMVTRRYQPCCFLSFFML